MPFSHAKPDHRTNEDVFFDYYPRLLEWAAQITRNDRAEAEDLVHDFYLRVSRIRRPIDEMEQIESYLFRVLRNLYYSRLRRGGRDPLNDLSIVDYDSVEQGLSGVDRRELLFVRDHLKKVCRYACERKSTVRSASVLILRFFHGYYPTEVMKILQTGRSSVDMLLQAARNEARLLLQRPDVLRFISRNLKAPVSFPREEEGTEKVFAELQEAIFNAPEGECLDPKVLEERYAADGAHAGLTTQELSHLVSCRACLDRVNTILGLPLLEDRSPEDGIYRDSGGPGGGGGSRATGTPKKPAKKEPPVRRLKHRARELFEHRPAKLQIVVDGEVRASQKVTAETNELQLALARKEKPSFIEIMSEQGFCLACLQVDDPDSADRLEQAETSVFSDNRSLVLRVSFASEVPIIHVLYQDPLMSEAEVVQPDVLSMTARPRTASSSPSEETEPRQRLSLVTSLRKALSRLLERLFDGPAGYAAILTAASVCAFLVLSHFSWNPPQNRLLPGQVLQRAVQKEQALPVSAAAHGIYSYEEADASGHVEATGEVDSWRQSAPRRVALRFYGAHHALLRGFLQDPHGDTGYRRKAAGEYLPIWHDVPSAEAFASLLPAGAAPEMTQSGEDYRMVVHSLRSRPEVVEAVLVIDRRSMRAVEEDYQVRDAEGVHSVRLRETSYEVRAAGTFDDGVFDVGRDFDKDSRHSRMEPDHLENTAPDTAPLELQVLTDLMQAGEKAGEQVDVHRDRQTGIVAVTGVVDTPERKQVLIDAIAPLAGNPHLRIALYSADELPQPSPTQRSRRKRNQILTQPASPIEVDSYEAASSKIPADAVLRAHFQSIGLNGARLDAAVHAFASQVCSQSLEAQQHAYRLAQLAAEFTPGDLARLDTDSRLQWLVLVSNYSEALNGDLRLLRSELRGVFGDTIASLPPNIQNSLSPLTSPTELAAASRSILSETARLNQQVQSAFSVTAVSPASQPDLQPAGNGAFAEIARLLDAAESMAGNVSATAQHLQLFATNAK
jgi:RNA polymerase sigma factor (sigma-70 family)